MEREAGEAMDELHRGLISWTPGVGQLERPFQIHNLELILWAMRAQMLHRNFCEIK